MEVPEETTMKDVLIQVIKDCTDLGLLDLIYKVLTHK